MKRKFLILTLCFTIIFSSINIKKSYADFVISPIMLATVSALAVGTGIALNGADDLYDIGRLFVDYVNNNNSIMWDTVQSAFHSSVAFNQATKQVTVGKDFGSIVKGFFDKTFGSVDKNSTSSGVVNIGYKSGYPDLTGHFSRWSLDRNPATFRSLPGVNVGSLAVGGIAHYSNGLYKVKRTDDFTYELYNSADKLMETYTIRDTRPIDYLVIYTRESRWYCVRTGKDLSTNNDYYDGGTFSNSSMLTFGATVSLPYNPGTYNPGNVWGDTESGEGLKDVPIYVPGNLGDLVGSNPGDIVGDKAPGWVGNGNISIPNVDNPSIGIGGSTSFPNVGVENPPTDIPGVENPPVGVIPPFPSFGNSLDFSPMYLTNINEKFPFSLPWDIGRLIEKFDIEPKAPIFKVPIFTSEIELDLTIFDEWANIVRFFVLIGFVLSLILISTKLLG